MDFALAFGEEHFQYEPLELGHIRLITVFPVGHSKIGCRFLHVPLNDSPVSYVALSYVWGDPAIVSKAYCSIRHVLGLTASAHHLLSLMVETHGTVYFWIDLLCINQADNGEKARQVRLMGDIFASAERVAAWLGEPSSDSRQALQFILTILKALGGYPNIVKDGHPITLDELCWSFPSSDWTALSNLLRRPWFQRIWVVQEAVRARHLTIFCEHPSLAITWDHLAIVTHLLRITDNDMMLRVIPTDYSIPSFLPDGILNTATKRGFRHLKKIGSPLTLQAALVDCRRFKSTDPRDMIYAILGIATDADDDALDPDYAASVQTIFTRTTRILLTTNNSLQILHIAGIGWPRALADIPSWVPDWTMCPRFTIFGHVEEYGPKYSAAGTSPIVVRAGKHQDTIFLKGVVIDTIVKVSAPLKAGSHDPSTAAVKSNSATIISWLEDATAIANSSLAVQDNGQASDHLWRTLIANHERGKPAPLDFEGLFPQFIKCHKHMAAFGSTDGLDDSALHASNRFTNALGAAIHSGVDGRLLFRTSNGYLGLSPQNTMVGDTVCVVWGATTPFLIRVRDCIEERGEICYSLVGECYVHELMNGEGLEMGETQDICLV